jgi:CheY-like chemotaxis protein
MPHILLIEDDDDVRNMLRKTLEVLGHTVAAASNGKEAIALYQTTPADIVLTDIIMPEKDGLETIRELRRNHPEIKIIAMSGGGRVSAKSYLPIAKMLGAAQILTKPFTHDQITAAINSVLTENPQKEKNEG